MTSPDFSSLLDSLFNLHRFGIKLGLEHTYRLLESIGNPQKNLVMIHVAGTNGKGSTCAQIANILRATGKKIGLYTSPHLIRFNERIRINGQPISDDEIISFMKQTVSAIEEIKSTFFETTTAMALNHFKNQKVDVAVIETGLGGRLDSTNVIDPQVTVITHISMDHMDILGKDLEKIAYEKAGIIKNGIPLIVAEQTLKVKNILIKKAQDKKTIVTELGEISEISITTTGTKFQYKGGQYFTSLIGEHQAVNAALAIECIHQFDPGIQNHLIQKGLKNVSWPARIQKLDDRLYYDVAHNEDGLAFFLKTIRNIFPHVPLFGLFCLKGDKELHRLVKKLSGQFSKLIVTTDQKELLLSAGELSEKLISVGINNESVESVSSGIAQLRELIKDAGVGLIFGSHYIAEEVFSESEISFDPGVI
ncbi:MAG TPA: bifunctional folylpolyglutamate synthase/dihydrofolate synthase [Candidatus Marinimicrobia bacterium]|nr:bifunctional folylpolyglutamate synthase/dihydrofolate synthase [Candidatus Neomarinimicrobiota bacterium]